MRISAERLGLAEQRTNPLGERELVLRGLAIPAIENLGTTRNAFDTIDFTDNRISRLENFPRLERLMHLMLSSNVVESIDVQNLSTNVPNLRYLELSHNHVASLHQVANLGKACSRLETLSLVGNPVTRRQHYRLYTIHHIPTLKVLDFTKVSKSERERAQRLARSAAGAALEQDVAKEKTFVPGEGRSAQESFATSFTAAQKEAIRQMVANAKSPQEIEEIELSVQRGIFPGGPKQSSPSTVTPPTNDITTGEEETNGNDRKRKAADVAEQEEKEEEPQSNHRKRKADDAEEEKEEEEAKPPPRKSRRKKKS